MKVVSFRLWLWLAIAALIPAIFALDLLTRPGFASAVPYVAPVLLSLWLPGRRATLLVAALCTGLTFIGAFVPALPARDAIWQVTLNRVYALFAIWVAALLGLQRHRLLGALQQALQDVKRLVAARKVELEASNRALAQESAQRSEAEARVRRLLEAAPDGIIVLNAQGVIEYANAQMEELFGYRREELLGKPPELLLPDSLRALHVQHRQEFYQAPQHRPMGTGLALMGQRKDGTTFPVDITLNPLSAPEGTRVIASVRDVTEQRRLQQALVESEAHYRNLVERLPDVVYRIKGDPLRGSVEFVSSRAEEVVGYAPSAFYDDPNLFFRLVHPEDLKVLVEQTQPLLAGAPGCTRTYRVRQQGTGEYHYIEDRVAALRDPNGQLLGIEGVAWDATQQVLLHNALTEREAQYRTVLENTEEGVVIHVGQEIVYVNPAFLLIHGLSAASQALGRPPGFLAPPEYRETIRERELARQRGEPVPRILEYQVRRPDGQERSIQSWGTAVEYLGKIANISFLRDVTELVRAERALRESEAQYRAVVENANDAIVVNVGLNRVFVNQAYLDLVGVRDAPQVLTRPLDAFIVEEDRAMVAERTLARQRGEDAPGVYEYRIRRTDGQVRTVQTSAVLITYHGQAASLAILRDVTERRRMEEALQETNRRLAGALNDLEKTQALMMRQQRLNALGQMASGVVHDFNNALTPVVGFISMLLEHPEFQDDKEALRRYLQLCYTYSNNAVAIVGRLRNFYRPREATDSSAPVDLNGVARRAAEVTQFMWQDRARSEGRAITLNQELSPVPPVTGDAAELTEAVSNLVLNAVDALPEGGNITIRTLTEGNWVHLHVQDSGVGMSPEVKERCFEPFFTTKGDRGTGLGLAVTFGAVQRHGGTIDVTSQVGQGTTFSIRLPASA